MSFSLSPLQPSWNSLRSSLSAKLRVASYGLSKNAIVLLVLGMIDAGVAETRSLLFTGRSLGSDLSLGRYLGKLSNLFVVIGFVDCADLFADWD